jgi:hypothetical protein
VVAYASR